MKKTITILFLLSTFYSFSQQSYTDSLKTALTFANEDSNKVETLIRLCQAYAWSIPDTGMIYGTEALTLSKKLKLEWGEAWAYGVMGNCLTTLGNYPLALDYSFKALAYAEKANSLGSLLGTYGGLSLVYRDMGQYRQSLNYLQKAMSLVDPGVVNHNLLGNLASVYAKNNQPDSAIYYAAIALKYQPCWSGTLFVVGDSYYKLNQLDSAIYYLDLGIECARLSRTEIDFVDLYHGKAQVYQVKNQLDSAIFYARRAMIEPFGKYYPRGVLNAITTLSDLYETKHQPDSALKYLKVAINLRDSLFNREKTMAIQNLAFKEQEKQKDLEASKLKFKTQIKLNTLTGSLFTLLVIAFLLFRNNKQKQKSFNLLQDQKQRIDKQKTELEHTLSSLKSTQAQLIQSEKMASLGELTAGIAHEIQNPLNFINNFSEVNGELINEFEAAVSKEPREPSNEAEIISTIKNNSEKINHHGKRADAIVKSMLQHARVNSAEAGQKQLTDINQLADEYLRLAYQGYRAKDKDFNCTLQLDLDPGLPLVHVVPQDIGRVLLNLFNNAFWACASKSRGDSESPLDLAAAYTPTVTLSTKSLGSKSDSHRIEIRVKDNGTGIPQHVLEKIFQPFFTTKPSGQGTGLGLSLAYDIVKAHNGELKVDSREGEYSSLFYNYL